MSVTAVCKKPIGTDLVARSAFDTFVRKMGYERYLLSLCREELWILDFDLDDVKASESTVMLVSRTGIFVNPNTHTHVIVRPDELLPHGKNSGREELAIAVWAHRDPEIGPVTVAVRERMGVRNLRKLKRLILWWPRFSEVGEIEDHPREDAGQNGSRRVDERGDGTSCGRDGSHEVEEHAGTARGRREIASSMAATYSRKEGLLANPHYQSWSVVEKGLRPHEFLETIVAIEEKARVCPGL